MFSSITNTPKNAFPPKRAAHHRPAKVQCSAIWGSRKIALTIDNPLQVKPKISFIKKELNAVKRIFKFRSYDETHSLHPDGIAEDGQLKYRNAALSDPKHVVMRSKYMLRLQQAYNNKSEQAVDWLGELEELYADAVIEGGASQALIKNYAQAGLLVSRLYCNAGMLSESVFHFRETIENIIDDGDIDAVPEEILQHYVYLIRSYVSILDAIQRIEQDDGDIELAEQMREESRHTRARLFNYLDINLDSKGTLKHIDDILSEEEEDEESDIEDDTETESEPESQTLNIRPDTIWHDPEPALILPEIEALQHETKDSLRELKSRSMGNHAEDQELASVSRKKKHRRSSSGYETDSDTAGKTQDNGMSRLVSKAIGRDHEEEEHFADEETTPIPKKKVIIPPPKRFLDKDKESGYFSDDP